MLEIRCVSDSLKFWLWNMICSFGFFVPKQKRYETIETNILLPF